MAFGPISFVGYIEMLRNGSDALEVIANLTQEVADGFTSGDIKGIIVAIRVAIKVPYHMRHHKSRSEHNPSSFRA